MRALARCLLTVTLVSAAGTARAEKQPNAAEKAEIQRLEKDLYQQEIKQAYLAAIPIARQLYDLQCQATGAVALAESKQYEGARQAFERAQGFPALRRAALYNGARALELAGKKAEAKKAYQQYAVVFPGGPWAKAAEAAAAKL